MNLINLLKDKNRIHFIGIGGSGMFPLVEILRNLGYFITGSDNNESDITRAEEKMGIKIYMNQKAENIKDADLIVYSAAILEDNEELVAALESSTPTIPRCELLGALTELYDRCVCVSGTHGKTSTSSMLTQILLDAKKDPTCVIGGKLKSTDSYGISGRSDIMVCEACEYSETYLHLDPNIAVILNIDNDHMDYFKNMDNLKNSFYKFAIKATNSIIYNGDDSNSADVVEKIDDTEKISFGFDSINNFYPKNIRHESFNRVSFDVYKSSSLLGNITLCQPGSHNILNALAATVCALKLGVSFPVISKSLENFAGAGRRFDLIGEKNGITVIDDYAHHPTEISTVLDAAKKLDFNKVWVLFQPFTYSRTKSLLKEFAAVLSKADRVVLTEIMGSREKNIYDIHSSDLSKLIDGSKVFKTQKMAADYIINTANSGDLVLTLGCGDIYKAAKIMVYGKY